MLGEPPGVREAPAMTLTLACNIGTPKANITDADVE
jgi:hypothetical protein